MRSRAALDQGAAVYMKNCVDFLDSQNAAMKREFTAGATPEALTERLDKITWVRENHRPR